MRRFELTDGSSAKFWEIDHDDGAESFTVRFGRIGTNGQAQTKSFTDATKAKTEHTKLVAEKVKKGYSEIAVEAGAAIAAPSPRTSTPNAGSARREVDQSAGRVALDHEAAQVDDGSEDRLFWDSAIARRAFAVRDAPLPAGPSAASLATAWADFKNPASWSFQRSQGDATSYLSSTSADRATAVPLMRHSLEAANAIAARDGIMFAIEALSEVAEAGHHRLRDLGWLRAWIAAAPPEEYEHYARRAEELAGQRPAFAFLFPTEGWARSIADGANLDELAPLASALPTPGSINAWGAFHGSTTQGSRVVSLVHRFGLDALPVVLAAHAHDADAVRIKAQLVARMGSDDGFAALIALLDDRGAQQGIADACQLQPGRAVRMLSAVKGKNADAARLRLASIAAARPDAVESVRPTLAADQQRVLDEIMAPRPEPAPMDRVPAVLSRPPWLEKRTAAVTRPVLNNVELASVPTTIEWAAGQQDLARRMAVYDGFSNIDILPDRIRRTEDYIAQLVPGTPIWQQVSQSRTPADVKAERERSLADWRRQLAAVRLPDLETARQWLTQSGVAPHQIVRAPAEIVDELLARPPALTGDSPELVRVLATHELRAERYVMAAVCLRPATLVPQFEMVGSSLMAAAAADALASKSARRAGQAWLLRFPLHAATGLIPVALRPLGTPRDNAERALRFLDRNGHGEQIRDVARTGGSEVIEAVQAVLSLDPLLLFPTKRPTVPEWVVPALLAPVELADGSGCLPDVAVHNLVSMLAFSSPDEQYAGIDVVKARCTKVSLARFGWSLLQLWQSAGFPNAHGWALTSLGVIGDDEVARKLAALIRVWPGDGGAVRAKTGLGVLATIGTDVSLLHLNRIAQTSKFKGLKEQAKERITEIAEARGLTEEELADRLVPDLGLDDDGSMLLDFGPRRFRVGFDELLAPFVRDEAGAKLRALPKPNSKDDPEKAKSAADTWKGLKKDASDAAKIQMRRIELAMCARRRWDGDTFRALFVDHPLIRHVARRLVWGTYDDNGVLTDTFRIAEDLTFADADDDTYTLPSDAIVGMPHVIEVGDDAGRWSDVFADYELLQPFPQLGRETYTITDEERATAVLKRAEGVRCHFGKILALEYRGWRKGEVWDAGVVGEMVKPLPSGRVAVLDLGDGGLYMGAMTESPEQVIGAVHLTSNGVRSKDDTAVLGDLSPIEFSELVRDVETLR